MPRTKQMESKMFDFPLPFNPVMALKYWSNWGTTVRCAYDLKPSMQTSSTYIIVFYVWCLFPRRQRFVVLSLLLLVAFIVVCGCGCAYGRNFSFVPIKIETPSLLILQQPNLYVIPPWFFHPIYSTTDVLDKNILKWQRLQETPTPEEKAGEWSPLWDEEAKTFSRQQWMGAALCFMERSQE